MWEESQTRVPSYCVMLEEFNSLRVWLYLFQIIGYKGICGYFLWTSGATISRKSLIAWKKVCKPRT